MKVPFVKMNGCGNDFVIFDNRESNLQITQEQIVKIANRRTSIGCDQLLVLSNSADTNCYMRIFNADGHEASACGNGLRCVAKLIFEEQAIETEISIETTSGVYVCTLNETGEILVNLGAPKFVWSQIPLSQNINTSKVSFDFFPNFTGFAVNVGNPHIIFFVENLELVDIEKIGPMVENHILFPEKVNVNFAQIIDSQNIKLRTWERGVGLTPACGTGSCATLVAAVNLNISSNNATIIQDGGRLNISWQGDAASIFMSGDAEENYRGVIRI